MRPGRWAIPTRRRRRAGMWKADGGRCWGACAGGRAATGRDVPSCRDVPSWGNGCDGQGRAVLTGARACPALSSAPPALPPARPCRHAGGGGGDGLWRSIAAQLDLGCSETLQICLRPRKISTEAVELCAAQAHLAG